MSGGGAGTVLAGLLVLTAIKATPLIFAALGGVLAERSGVVNIALEGIMAVGAFMAVCVAGASGNALAGAAAGVAAGALLAAILAFVATRLGYDQIVAGTGCNIVALAGTAYGLVLVFGQPGASHEVPALGAAGEVVLTVLAFVLVGLLAAFLERTPWGLRVRACGENPHAAASAGIDPRRTRFAAVVAGGAIAALGGVYLSLAELDLYSDGMTAGRGFIALAAVIFGRWTPVGAAAAALCFGFFAALQYTLQRSGIPSEAMQALPYVAALVALAGFAGRVRAPAAEGVPYEDGHIVRERGKARLHLGRTP
jgi:simple sugar transport system permease protein